jgi:hypothetical protein
MNAKDAAKLIEAAGGDTAFGRLLGWDDQPRMVQRINNWKRRGMPARVELDHQLVIYQLQRKIERQGRSRKAA